MEPCNQRRVAGPCSSQKYQMTQSQYSVNVLVGEVGATGLIVIPAPFPEGWACCCSPGCNRIGLGKQRLGTPGAVRVGGIEQNTAAQRGEKRRRVFGFLCVYFFFLMTNTRKILIFVVQSFSKHSFMPQTVGEPCWGLSRSGEDGSLPLRPSSPEGKRTGRAGVSPPCSERQEGGFTARGGWFRGFKRQSSFKECANYSSIFSPLISNSFKAERSGKPCQRYPLSNVPWNKMVSLKLQGESAIPESVSVPSKE